MKKCVAFILVFIMLFSNFCYAMPTLMRNETVYINLDNNGDVKEIKAIAIIIFGQGVSALYLKRVLLREKSDPSVVK